MIKYYFEYRTGGKYAYFRFRKRRYVCKYCDYLEKNNYKINGDILLLPSFLNLDGYGSEIEVLYIPIN